MTGIYVIKYPNGKVYVGQSLDIFGRWHNHVKTSRSAGKRPLLPSDSALKKYGVDNCELEVLEVCDAEHLNDREAFWIESKEAMISGGKGYNCTIEHKEKRIFSDETRLRMREAAKRKPPMTEETKHRISKATKGHKRHSQTQIQKLVQYNKTRTFKFSEETRQKLSEKAKGRPAWNKGVPMAPDVLARMKETKRLNNKNRKRVYCSQTREIFESVGLAKMKYGSSVKSSLASGKPNRRGLTFEYQEKRNG